MTPMQRSHVPVATLAFWMVVVISLSGGRALAEAPPSEAAKAAALAIVREGNRLLVSGRPEAALAKFKEAHQLVGGDKLFYNFGQAYRFMPGRDVEAYEAFETYLERARTASPESQAAARTEQAQVRKKLALVTVATTPVGVTVLVDGQPRGDTPLPAAIAVAPGTHSLRLARDGYRSLDETLTLTAGQTLERNVQMTKAAANTAATVGTVAPATVVPPPPILETRRPPSPPLPSARPPAASDPTPLLRRSLSAGEPAPSDDRPVYTRWWFWTGVAAVVTGVGAVVWLASRKSPDCGTGVHFCANTGL